MLCLSVTDAVILKLLNRMCTEVFFALSLSLSQVKPVIFLEKLSVYTEECPY